MFSIKSKLLLVKASRFFVIFSIFQFHHCIFSKCFITSSLNLFFFTSHGFPTAIVYGGMSFATTEFAPMIAPSPIWTPGRIVTFCPIQTSFPITVSPLYGVSFNDCAFFQSPPKILKGMKLRYSILCIMKKKVLAIYVQGWEEDIYIVRLKREDVIKLR